MLCHQSKAFVVPKTETMRIFSDYVIRPPTIKGFTFSSAFSIFLSLNWTLFNLNWGFSSGSGKSLELNWWSSSGFGKNRLWTELNQTFPSLIEDHTGEIFSWELAGISVVPVLEIPVDWLLGCVFESACGGSNWPGYSSEPSSTCLMRLISLLLTGSAVLRCTFTTCRTRSSCSTVVKWHQFQISNGSGAIRS